MKCFSLPYIRSDFELEISGRKTESDLFDLYFLLLLVLYSVSDALGLRLSSCVEG